MAERKKPPNAGKGRPRGVPNKATADVRAAVALLAQKNVNKLQRWLDQTANGVKTRAEKGKPAEYIVKPDPGRAAQIFGGMLEYHIPKLSRTELSTGTDTLKIEIVDPTKRGNSAPA